MRDGLRLSTAYRHPFVLRIVVGLSQQECLNLLQGDSKSIDTCVGAAAVELCRGAEQGPDDTFGFVTPTPLVVRKNHASMSR